MATIQYFRRSVFGRIENMPTGEHENTIKTLTRRKTLTQEDIDALVSLGHTVEKVPNPSEL